MPIAKSLDELIARNAVEFADQVKKAAALADKEEEIRIEVERQLAFIEKEAGIELHGKHEFTVAKGRADSVYSRVIIEYKNPSDPSARIGPKADSPGSKKVVKQIKDRFQALNAEHGHALGTLFGVGLDGKHFIFVRYRDEKWDVQEPVEVNRHSAERFLWALFNLGQKGKPFSPEYLAGDFGANETSIALPGVHALYEAIVATDHPKARTFFNQWKILFGEVCGYDVDNPSDKVKKLADSYSVAHKGLKPAELLFALHSYYALFMKLLAAETVAFFHRGLLKSQVQKLLQAETSRKLKRELEELEAGSIFRHLNITNFLEGDLFAWYTAVWSDPIEKLVRDMMTRLDDYNPGTLSENPATSRDLLKKLYQQLFPKSVRHDLGEYYTPDWLAEHVLNELGYEGDPDKRLLDPACGSGTFLLMAINRIKKWYEENRERCAYDEAELVRKILANVVGFDLNPLAVMAARTNYLIAIRDLVSHADKVEIPVYLCDSIMTPSEYGDLFSGGPGKSKAFKTAAATFIIPTEIATSKEDVAKYAAQLESCVQNGYSAEEFLTRCRDEGLPAEAENLHTELYNELVALDKANKNGVWARIIKNAFAPLFVGKVDYIAGNPPWVNWENLPEDYRAQSATVWDRYALRQRAAGRAAIGKSKHELSALFLYVSVDSYLAEGGRLGFVITQSLFKNKGGAGFRALRIGTTYLKPIAISDFVPCTVFEGAVNRTATIVVTKDQAAFSYPVPYRAYYPKREADLPETATLQAIEEMTSVVEMDALPSESEAATSPWLTCPRGTHPAFKRVLGPAYFRAFEGVNSGGLVGAFWVQVVRDIDEKAVLIENLWDAGKIKVPHVTHQVERDLIYPYLRGRDVKKWFGRQSCFYLLTHTPESRKCISEKEMRRKFPKSYEYLSTFKKQLLARKTAPLRDQMKEGPFYPILGIGPHTVAPWKVVFKDLTEFFQACVLGPQDSSIRDKPLLPDYTLRLIPAQSEDEAHYVAALLNSAPSVAALYYSSTGVQTQRYHAGDAEKIAIGEYKALPIQRQLAGISKKCHLAAGKEDRGKVAELEKALDVKAAEYWGISPKDVARIENALDLANRGHESSPEGGRDEEG